jgi:hypothetical protein
MQIDLQPFFYLTMKVKSLKLKLKKYSVTTLTSNNYLMMAECSRNMHQF